MVKYLFIGMVLAMVGFPLTAQADTLHLKNGNSLTGIIKSEDSERVELEIDIGTVKFRRNEIESIDHGAPSEIVDIRRQWQKNRQRHQEEQKIRLEIEQNNRRLEDLKPKSEKVAVDRETGHIIADATVNGSVGLKLIVDTGATMVVLSKKAGDRLAAAGIRQKKNKIKQVELTLGDGRKVMADFVVLDSVRIENSVTENVEAAILTDDGTTPGYDGVLGMSFLSRFNFGFNQREGKLTLEKLK